MLAKGIRRCNAFCPFLMHKLADLKIFDLELIKFPIHC